jgi:tRNA(Ile)-lysidine synthase
MNGIPNETQPLVWQALAGRAGVVLDRRGTLRLTETTPSLNSGGRISLSGGFELVADDTTFTFRRSPGVETQRRELSSLSLSHVTRFGAWRFSPVTEATIKQREEGGTPSARGRGQPNAWFAWLPENAELALRAWQNGDRIATNSTTRERRRVKRFFSDFRVPSFERAGWPVVLLDDEIIWIPGIRRTPAATDRSGRPGKGVCILCERLDD